MPASPIPDNPDWRAVMKAFGWEVHLCPDTEDIPTAPQHIHRAIVYRLGDTEFLGTEVLEKSQWDGVPVSYDFKVFRQATAYDEEKTADYDCLANASEGVKWLRALRMDVDDLGKVFSKDKLKSATISRLATLSASLRLFFTGIYTHYHPMDCFTHQKSGALKWETIVIGIKEIHVVNKVTHSQRM